MIFDKSKNIWFSLSDMLKTLGYNSYRDEIKSIDNYVDKEDISTYKEILGNNIYTSKCNFDLISELRIGSGIL